MFGQPSGMGAGNQMGGFSGMGNMGSMGGMGGMGIGSVIPNTANVNPGLFQPRK